MKYFCVGIKGSGMSTLASILSDLGNEVAGYDDNQKHAYTQDGLEERGINIYYNQDHPIDPDTIVTYSKAFSNDHPEIKMLREKGLEFVEYNELLGKLTSMFNTVCVSGTHGKTTTSLMLSGIMNNTIGTNYFVGDGSGHATKENEHFVIESCEYMKHFLAYHPTVTIITNIELEHVECYNGIEDIRNTFQTLANRGKEVIACGDDENIRLLNLTPNVTYYGFGENNDVRAINIEMGSFGSTYDVIYKGENLGKFHIPLTGKHMILNSLAAISTSLYYGIDLEHIKDNLSNFQSPKRRFKESFVGDNVVIDDYAHHPTELKVTIEAARAKYPDKQIIAIFKPNTYSRTEALEDGFVEALSTADVTYLTPIDCNREKQSDYPNVSSDNIVNRIPGAKLIEDTNTQELLPYDNACILFMSCANIYSMKDKYIAEKEATINKTKTI